MDSDTVKSRNLFLCRYGLSVFLAAVMAVTALSVLSFAQDANRKKFKSPEEAFNALIEATKKNDSGELLSIFGPAGMDIISSGDAVSDKEDRARFIKAAGDEVAFSTLDDKTMIAVIGKRKWSFPIPLVKSPQGWFFFTEDGREEIINRRIGRNELIAIQVTLACVDGQFEYASMDRDGDGVVQYARKFVSHAGRKDGLYWEAAAGDEVSPLGPLVARATEEGYTLGKKGEKPTPYHGYYFRILRSQGSNAPGGELDYIIDGRMTGGFGFVAYPAEYGVSGVMTFIVNQDGQVHQKDLGPKTEEIAKTMKKYDPDKTWKKVDWTPEALAKQNLL
jgi:hypothetical protein